MNKQILIKEIFIDKEFASLLKEYFDATYFDINEIMDYAPRSWDVEVTRSPLTEEGAKEIQSLDSGAYAAFNTTMPEDSLFSAIVVKIAYKNIFVWFLTTIGLEGWEPMSDFNIDNYELEE